VTSDPIRRSAARTATFIAVPVAVAVLLVSALAFGGFGAQPPAPVATGPVTMAERDLAPEIAELCRAVIADLPETAAGYERRAVTAGAEQDAAYGDPPLTLECGTTQPNVGLTDDVFNIAPPGGSAGVCWYPVAGDNATVWTTVDRTVPVTVTVPGPAQAAAQSIPPFSAAVGANLPLRDDVPFGCTGTGATPTD
jgi:hypothetical protein